MADLYEFRCLDHESDHSDGKVDILVSPVTEAARRVFVVLDLSDSCRAVLPTLKRANWVWQRIPPQWQVTLFALSDAAPLHPLFETMYVRDLAYFFNELEGAKLWDDWLANHKDRGSFLQPTLDGIEEICTSEDVIDGSIPSEPAVLVVTDGELLDPDPIQLPAGMKCIGILCNEIGGSPVRWERVLPQCPLLESRSTELIVQLDKVTAPGSDRCDIVSSFSFETKGPKICEVRAGERFSWDFSVEPLIISVANSVIGRSDAFVEFHSGRRVVTTLTLDTLSSQSIPESTLKFPSASLANELIAVVDDYIVVKQLLAALRTRSSNGLPLDENSISLLQRGLMVCSQFDNAIFIVAPRSTFVKPDKDELRIDAGRQSVLLVGKLYKDPSKRFFMACTEIAPQDPGVAPREDIFVQYDQDAARWHLFVGEGKRTLAPRGGGALLGVFIDVNGKECEAYYSGPLLPRMHG